MTSVLILGFIAGLLGGNGLPHFVKGITGQKYHSPFGKESSAAVNVIWGWINFVVAVLVWHIAPMRQHPRAAFLAVSLGVLAIGLILANTRSKHQHNK
ncbi:MAG: hypothetical protein ABSD10_01750 [Candidatus Saccharimonadales bacterium]|jgi:hypothetical protein